MAEKSLTRFQTPAEGSFGQSSFFLLSLSFGPSVGQCAQEISPSLVGSVLQFEKGEREGGRSLAADSVCYLPHIHHTQSAGGREGEKHLKEKKEKGENLLGVEH